MKDEAEQKASAVFKAIMDSQANFENDEISIDLIAAALREAHELLLQRDDEIAGLVNQIEDRAAEIAKLNEELSRMTESRDNWRASCKQVENERDAAFVRGLERANQVVPDVDLRRLYSK